MNTSTLSDEMLSIIWSPEKYDPEGKKDYLLPLRECCVISGNGIGEWLCGKRSLRSFPLKEMRNLENQLKSPTLRNALRDVTSRAQRFNPSLPLARIAIETKRLPNPINPDLYTAENLSASRDLIESLGRMIRHDLEHLTAHGRVGLLLLSAAYYGGLMDIPQLSALIQVDPRQVIWLSGIPEFRLNLSIRGQPEAEKRQWFPDPITLALLSRCAPDLAEIRPYLARKDGKLKCIQAVLAAGGGGPQNQPASLERVFELLRIQRQTQLPQLLMNYAMRSSYVTHSVLSESWLHLHGNTPPLNNDEKQKRKKHRFRRPEQSVPEWLTVLCRNVRKKQFFALENERPPKTLETLIGGWASFLIHSRSFYGNQLQPNTVANYVRNVSVGLDNLLSVESILDVPPDALEDLYEQMLEAQPTTPMRRNLAKGLLEFHGYLQKNFGYPPISPYTTLGIGRTPQFVDAQIINEEQYRLALRDLATGPLSWRSPRLAMVAQAMVIFGFRLGLRRNEALKPLRCDLQLPALSAARAAAVRKRHPSLKSLSPEQLTALELPVSLHIRPHSQRTLKTRSSTRTLPLHVLLDADELQLIERLARLRDDEEMRNPYSEFLFCIPELQTRWVSESTLMPAIHDALRRVTGCSDMHYHHLRHSAATWLTFKLAASALDVNEEARLLFGEHSQTITWLLDAERLNRTFFHSQEAATRRIAHITSAVLGHASPKISLLHYVHCMPWLSALCWQWNPEFWPPGHVIAKISQVSLPNKPDDLPASGLPTEICHMQRIIGRIRVYKRGSQLKIKRPLSSPQKGDGKWALTRMNEISSMLAYQAYAEASGESVNMDWVEFAEADRLSMLARARYISHLGNHRLHGPATSDSSLRVELVPSPPKHGSLAGVAAYADRLYRLLSSRYKAKASRVLDDFVERCWASDTTLRFYSGKDGQSAREYIWLLSEMGIPLVDTEFIIYDDRTPKQTRKLWRAVLGKPRLRFIEHVAENRDTQNRHLGIRVILRLPGAELNVQELNHHSGAALRYLFLMASIDWHFRV
jgi:integrase